MVIKLNKRKRTATVLNRSVKLSPLEFKLLQALAARSPHFIPSTELLKTVWGSHAQQKVNYLKLYVYYLRSKLEENPSKPRLIVTQRKCGYRLLVPTNHTSDS